VKELSNIEEGEEKLGSENDWESDEDEEWEDVAESRGSEDGDVHISDDLLNGVNTKVSRLGMR
jgi:hypothetical protein